MSIATIAVTFAYLVSLVLAAHQPSTMMASDEVSMTSGMRGAPSLLVPVGVVSNQVDAQGNNVMVSRSNILISQSDRVTLAHTIEDMMSGSTDPMTSESLFGLLARAALNPTVYSNAAGIISAARSGNTGALAGHVVNLLGAVLPPTTTTPVVVPTAAPLPVLAPVVATFAPPAVAPAAISVSPIVVPSPMSPPIAPAAATTSTSA